MYIGSTRPCERALERAGGLGLDVERIPVAPIADEE